jgi:hypothetical protein
MRDGKLRTRRRIRELRVLFVGVIGSICDIWWPNCVFILTAEAWKSLDRVTTYDRYFKYP